MGMAQLRRVIVAALAVVLLAAGKRRQAISCGMSHYACALANLFMARRHLLQLRGAQQ
jgi:hypothetical protein